MVNRISYTDNPEHYKRLIRKINEEVDFASYLTHKGYKLHDKSAGSMEFINDNDKIVLTTSRSPITYFNRNDSEDKGLFFKYLRSRKTNFYETIKDGLEIINRSYEHEIKNINVAKKSTQKKSLEENYNIVPLSNPIYLTKERLIDIKTINSDSFKGRIFNAFHHNDNGSKIANIAFPKSDVNGNPQNYIICNRPYKDRSTGKMKKFKLVLNKKDHFLFSSNLPKKGVRRIIIGESGIDLLSFNELRGKEGDFYISFGGNVYTEKLDFFYQLITPIISKKNTELVSIFDNDIAGYEYDLKVFTKMVNELAPGIYFENNYKQGVITIKIHYNADLRNQIGNDSKKIESFIKTDLFNDHLIKNIVFLDKLLLEFSLSELIKARCAPFENMNGFRALLLTLNKLYLPIETNILKSYGEDWNQDLKDSKKKGRFIAMNTIECNEIQHGDKIVLKTDCGPEGTINTGIVNSVRKSGVLADFGIRFLYLIPLNAIKTHLKLVSNESNKIKEFSKEVNSKNQIKL
ncbi:Toprim-like [Flaviramulus basaltis]|uniref:Toprim-like n=1 Tax=Flaviramulus basaltis TaxID=369401 RepID=A0A1K2IT14_9FLAO|nr:toprim domain-containing protein [Flaviramulus basaltis]SFZ94859.1 Toprim-like [Flaviramulus basaltis]